MPYPRWIRLALLAIGALFFLLLPFALFAADIAAPVRWQAELSRPAGQKLEHVRGSTSILEPQFLSYGAALDLTGATNVLMLYKTSTMTDPYACTGTVICASNGLAQFRFGPAQEGTNSSYAYTLFVGSSTSAIVTPAATISILGSIGTDSTNSIPPPVLWSSLVARLFSNVTQTLDNALTNLISIHAIGPGLSYHDNTLYATGGTVATEYDLIALAALSAHTTTHARVNSRLPAQSFTVTVTNGTYSNGVAVLRTNGVVTIACGLPIAQWQYSADSVWDLALTPGTCSGGQWTAGGPGLLSRGDVTNCRIAAGRVYLPSPPDTVYHQTVSVSNIAVWTWSDASVVGTTNDTAGVRVQVDDPAGDRDAVPRKYMTDCLATALDGVSAAGWSSYDAAGASNYAPSSINAAGLPLHLDNHCTLLATGSLFALQYNGQDILTVEGNNALVSAHTFTVRSNLVTVGVSAADVASAPWLEVCTDLMVGRWSKVKTVAATYPVPSTNGLYTLQVTQTWDRAFFRAVVAGTNGFHLVSQVLFEAPAIRMGGVTITNWPDESVFVRTNSTANIDLTGARVLISTNTFSVGTNPVALFFTGVFPGSTSNGIFRIDSRGRRLWQLDPP